MDRTIAITITRVVVIYRTSFIHFSASDPELKIWSSVEFAMAIIICCGPMLRPVFEKIFPATLTGRRTKASDNDKSEFPSSVNGRPKGFSRLRGLDNSEIPLDNMANDKISVIGGGSRNESYKSRESLTQIKVKSEWKVDSYQRE